MPLLAGKKNIGHNIKVEEEHGKPRRQAVAIALSKAGVSKGKDASGYAPCTGDKVQGMGEIEAIMNGVATCSYGKVRVSNLEPVGKGVGFWKTKAVAKAPWAKDALSPIPIKDQVLGKGAVGDRKAHDNVYTPDEMKKLGWRNTKGPWWTRFNERYNCDEPEMNFSAAVYEQLKDDARLAGGTLGQVRLERRRAKDSLHPIPVDDIAGEAPKGKTRNTFGVYAKEGGREFLEKLFVDKSSAEAYADALARSKHSNKYHMKAGTPLAAIRAQFTVKPYLHGQVDDDIKYAECPKPSKWNGTSVALRTPKAVREAYKPNTAEGVKKSFGKDEEPKPISISKAKDASDDCMECGKSIPYGNEFCKTCASKLGLQQRVNSTRRGSKFEQWDAKRQGLSLEAYRKEYGTDTVAKDATDFEPGHLDAAKKALNSGLTLGQFLRGLPRSTSIPKAELQKYSDAYVAIRGAAGRAEDGEDFHDPNSQYWSPFGDPNVPANLLAQYQKLFNAYYAVSGKARMSKGAERPVAEAAAKAAYAKSHAAFEACRAASKKAREAARATDCVYSVMC
jgi:hypothetical protein